MASTGVEVVGVGEIVCLTPPELRGRSLLTVADWELDGEVPSVPIMLSVPIVFHLTSSTTLRPGQRRTTTELDSSLLNWKATDFDEYADAVGVSFNSAIYDENHDDYDKGDNDNATPDSSYDFDDSRSNLDVVVRTTRVAVQSSFALSTPPTRSGDSDLVVVQDRLRLATTTHKPETTTSELIVVVASELGVERPTSGRSYVVPLAMLAILATLVVVVVVSVAIVTTTRRQHGRRPASIELKPTLNGVKQNGPVCTTSRRPRTADDDDDGTYHGRPIGSWTGRFPLYQSYYGRNTANCTNRGNERNRECLEERFPRYQSRTAEDDDLAGLEDIQVPRPRLPLVAFIDQQVNSGLDEPALASATDISRSVETLSLIPGRDINHEGPHRVYQWADF